MKWIEAKVSFDHLEPDLVADLVAAVFFDLDLQGVLIEDPSLAENADLSEDADDYWRTRSRLAWG